jgi:hypothetical protein
MNTPESTLAPPLATFSVVGAALVLVSGCMIGDSMHRGSPRSQPHDPVIGGSLDQPSVLMVGGSVARVDAEARTLTIRTPMNLQEIIRFDARTVIATPNSTDGRWRDVAPGAPVKIDYELAGDGSVLARTISVGQSVALCPCGYDCKCPPSRGCRVVRKASP